MAKAKVKPKVVPTIVGQYFLTFPSDNGKKGNVHWQGQVLAEQTPGVFLCQLYEWMVGCMSDTILVRIDRMVDEHWDFYERAEDWRNEGERRQRQYDRKSAREASTVFPAPVEVSEGKR
jgi:hypothetical protein